MPKIAVSKMTALVSAALFAACAAGDVGGMGGGDRDVGDRDRGRTEDLATDTNDTGIEIDVVDNDADSGGQPDVVVGSGYRVTGGLSASAGTGSSPSFRLVGSLAPSQQVGTSDHWRLVGGLR